MMKVVDDINPRPRKSVFLFLTLSVVINFIFAGDKADAAEFCLTETFEARCDGDGEVVVMTTALYGRMNLGRCLQKPYDTIGCHDDVLAVFDAKCSGRRHCRVTIPDKDLHGSSSCAHHQLIMYLEATFTCLRVFQSIPSKCSSPNAQTLTANHGYIAHATHGPTYRCSWRIRLPQGLRINVTLLDFETSRHLTKPSGAGPGGGGTEARSVADCYMYAYVREAGVLKTRICSGSERERVVYLSETNSIEVETLPVKTENSERSGNPSGVTDEEDGSDGDVVRYLLKYEAVGCADLPVTSAHMVVVRPEPDRLVISCDNATKPRYLVCRNGEWNGTVPACSQHSTQHEQGPGFWSKITSDWAHAILITVAIGMTLGIIMGVALLAALMTYLKRRDCRQKRAQQQQQQQQPAQYYSRSFRTTTEENNEVQIYYERSRGAFYTDTKAPPVEFMQDSWLLMGHHHQVPPSAAADDVACSCPASEGKLLSSPPGNRMTERQGGDNPPAGRKGHLMDTEHVYEMTC